MRTYFKNFWEKYIVDFASYPAECANCNDTTCDRCRPENSVNDIKGEVTGFALSCVTLIIFLIIITLFFSAIGGCTTLKQSYTREFDPITMTPGEYPY